MRLAWSETQSNERQVKHQATFPGFIGYVFDIWEFGTLWSSHGRHKGGLADNAVNTMRPRQNGRHFADTFKRIFLNKNVRSLIEISLKFVPKGPNNHIPSLFQIMAWRRPGDKPLSEPMMVCLPAHICVTRPQWVKVNINSLESKLQRYTYMQLISVWNVNMYDLSYRWFSLGQYVFMGKMFYDA